MKKAVISTGGKQYLVSEGETLTVELLSIANKTVDFQPLLVVDGEAIHIGTPGLEKLTVTAEVIKPDAVSEKVIAVRYKAKKRVHKVHGHRQHLTTIKISDIT